MEDQLLELGFVKYPDEVVMKPFRTYFAIQDKGDLHEVTLKRGRIYTSEKQYVLFETFIQNFKKNGRS